MLYLAVALYLAFLSFRYDYSRLPRTHFRDVHRYIALVVLVLLSGMRYRMAPDTVAYMAQFQTEVLPLGQMSWERLVAARYQPLWVILNSICKSLDSFILLQVLVAWIFNGCVFYFFRRATRQFFSAVLLYYLTAFFYFNMEIMRESLAVGMFLIAVVRYNDRRWLSFYFWLIAAALFHKFAAILFVIPFLLTRRISVVLKISVAIAVTVGLALLQNPLEYIESFGGVLADLDLKFYEVDSTLSPAGFAYHLLRIFPVVFFMWWFRERPLPELYMRKEVIFQLCWAFVVIVVIRIVSIPFLDRISNYFAFIVLAVLISVLGNILSTDSFRMFRIPVTTCVSFVGLLFYLLPLLPPDPKLGDTPPYRRYYPYYSVFSMQTDSDREYINFLEAKE